MNSSVGSLVCLHTLGGPATAFPPHACCFAGTPVCPHTLSRPTAVFLLYVCSSLGLLLHLPPHTPTPSGSPAALCPFCICTFHRPTHASSPSQRAHCCVPCCMPAAPWACSYDQPPLQLTPSRWAHSHISTLYTHILQAHSCVHTLGRPAGSKTHLNWPTEQHTKKGNNLC